MSDKLGRAFFVRSTLKVARDLVGCFVVRKIGQKIIQARIIETEAYVGTKDKANHASCGRTARTEVMFGEAGHLYIYLIYGIHYCLNVVTGKSGFPAAVLVRSIEVIQPCRVKSVRLNNLCTMSLVKINGPGRVCKFLRVDKRLNNEDVIASHKLWFESGKLRAEERILTGKRIGVAYAGKWQHKPWRFILKKQAQLSYD